MRKFIKFTSVGFLVTVLTSSVAYAVAAGDTGKIAISGLTVAECYDATNEQRNLTNVNNPNCHAQVNLFACYPKPSGCVCDAVVTSVSGDCGGVATWGPWY